MLITHSGWSQLKVNPSDNYVKIGNIGTLPISPLTVEQDITEVVTITGNSPSIRLVVNTDHSKKNSGIQFKENSERAWSMAHYKSSFSCSNGSNTDWTLYNDKLGIPVLLLDGNTSNAYFKGTVTSESTCITSDKNLKKRISPYSGGLPEVLKINPITFQYKRDTTNKTHIGVIAQELEEILPFAVRTNRFDELDQHGNPSGKTSEYYSIQADAIQYLLVNAIKEQQEIIKSLQSANEEKDEQIEKILSQINEIKSIVEPNRYLSND